MARLRLYALATVGAFLPRVRAAHRGNVSSGPVTLRPLDPQLRSHVRTGRMADVSTSLAPQPIRLLVAGRTHRGRGVHILPGTQPQLINSALYPVLIALELELASVAILATALLIGAYPDGVVERAWQRLALRCCWVVLLAAPLALLASPVTPVSEWVAERVAVANPLRGGWLGWLAEPALEFAAQNWWPNVVGVVVLCARFAAADAAGRARMRFMVLVLVIGMTLWSADAIASAFGVRGDSAVVVTLITLGALTIILIPVAIVYGILRHRLFDLDLVVRKSVAYGAASLVIAAAYAAIAATPGLMLGNRVPVTLAVITIAAALPSNPSSGLTKGEGQHKKFVDRCASVTKGPRPTMSNGRTR